jgi:hypothetical protein
MLHLEDIVVAVYSKYTLKSKYDRVFSVIMYKTTFKP